MNCRANEEKVFPSPEVSGVLEQHFVEARLHTDGEKGEQLGQLEQELAQSVATPIYLVLDPHSRRKLEGPLGATTSVAAFRQFLLDAIEASKERMGRLDER